MLKGERILLRPMKQADVARQHDFDQDIELYGLNCNPPQVASLESAQAFYERRTQSDDGTVPFAIETDSKYIGHCSLIPIPNRYGSFVLAITIGDRDYWGRGDRREVVKLLLDYAFRYLGARRIELTTHAKNERAIRCYRACGFVEEGRPRKAVWIEGEYADLVNMGLLREEWQARQNGV
jgi:RimJ/RimL family protein N-acetyltransferase